MKIKNYTTGISANRTLAEIETLLVENGSKNIWKQYSESGSAIAINFTLKTKFGMQQFHLDVYPEAVRACLIKGKAEGELPGISKSQATDIKHAEKVGWRIVLQYIEAVISMININAREPEEMLLPFIYNSETKQTLFQLIEEKGFLMLTGGDKTKEEVIAV